MSEYRSNEDKNLQDFIDSIDYGIVKGGVIFDFYQRVLNILLSIIGLAIGIPLIIIFGIRIKIEDNGPITYKQERLGKGGKRFYIYKLRSMRTDAEKFGAQ